MNESRDQIIGWRDLQNKADVGVTAIHRMPVAVWGWAIGLLFAGVGIWLLSGWVVRRGGIDGVAALVPETSEPMRQIHFATDGVLPDAWLARQHGLKPGVTLMDVDIKAIGHKLESFGQVKRAVVKRVFPDILAIELEERKPLLRMAVDLGNGSPVAVFAVSDDGVVYRPLEGAEAGMKKLPFIDGVKVAAIEDGGTRIDGVADVAVWMNSAAVLYPEYYADLRVVSLERYAEGEEELGSVLITRGKDFPDVVIRPGSAGTQIGQLRSSVDWLRREGRQAWVVDLSIPDEVVIR